MNCTENLAKQAEKAASKRNMKQLYNPAKKLARKNEQANKPVKDNSGATFTTAHEQMKKMGRIFLITTEQARSTKHCKCPTSRSNTTSKQC